MASENDIIVNLKVEGVDGFKASLKGATQATDTLDASIKRMEDTLKTVPENSKDFKRLSTELEALKTVANASGDAFENNRTALAAYKKEISGLATVMATLKSEGKQGTQVFKDIQAQFEATKKKAGELKDKIGDINNEISALGSDTRGIDLTLRGVQSLTAGYQILEGATGLLGNSNEDLQKQLVKLNQVMAVTSGIQQIAAEATREDSIFKLAAAKATGVYNLAVGSSTGVLKGFRLALAATGIGLILIAIAALVMNWDKFTDAIGLSVERLNKFKDMFAGIISGVKEFFESVTTIFKDVFVDKNFKKAYADAKKIGKNIGEAYKQGVKESGIERALTDAIEKADVEILKSRLNGKGQLDTAIKERNKIQNELDLILLKNSDKNSKEYLNKAIELKDKQDEIQKIVTEQTKKSNEAKLSAIKQGYEDELSLINVNINELRGYGILRYKEQLRAIDIEEKLALIEAKSLAKRLEIQSDFQVKRAELWENYRKENEFEIKPIVSVLPDLKALGFDEQIEYLKSLLPYLEEESVEYKQVEDAITAVRDRMAELSKSLEGIIKKPINKGGSLFDAIFGTPKEGETRLEELQRMATGAKKIVDQILSYGGQIASVASSAIQIQADNDLAELDAKRKKGIITQKQYEKESAKIKNEAAQKQRAVQIAMATAQIPQAVLSAFISALPLGLPIAGIVAGIAGAFAAAQVAVIAASPLPKFRHGGSVAKRLGYIEGAKHEQGGVPIEVEGGEYVIKPESVKRYGVKMLDNINNMKFNPVITHSKIGRKDNRLNENLVTISSYLKQGYKIDAQGNQILKEIRDNFSKRQVYV